MIYFYRHQSSSSKSTPWFFHPNPFVASTSETSLGTGPQQVCLAAGKAILSSHER